MQARGTGLTDQASERATTYHSPAQALGYGDDDDDTRLLKDEQLVVVVDTVSGVQCMDRFDVDVLTDWKVWIG